MPFIIFLVLFFLSCSAQATVLSSIRPLELIVKELLPEEIESSSLLSANVSPHDYALKISDAERLRDAELFVWIGPGMESFLGKAVARFVAEQKELRVSNDAGHVGHHEHKHSHDVSTHLWLSYGNAIDIANRLSMKLKKTYPNKREEIERKRAQFIQNAEAEFALTAESFNDYQDSKFFVYHDAYQEYVEEFNLALPSVVKRIPESQLSIHQVMKLKQKSDSASCMLVNVDESTQAGRLSNKLNLDLVVVDLLGAGLVEHDAPSGFFQYMANIRSSFLDCFRRRTDLK